MCLREDPAVGTTHPPLQKTEPPNKMLLENWLKVEKQAEEGDGK